MFCNYCKECKKISQAPPLPPPPKKNTPYIERYYPEYVKDKNKILKSKYLQCRDNHEKKFNENLKNRFSNAYKNCNLDTN